MAHIWRNIIHTFYRHLSRTRKNFFFAYSSVIMRIYIISLVLTMSQTRRKIEAKIAKKDQQIQLLENEIDGIETEILTLRAEKKGMEEVIKILPRE